MFAVNFIFKHAAGTVVFLFQDIKRARLVMGLAMPHISRHGAMGREVDIDDDYGAQARIDMNEVAGVFLVDIEQDARKDSEILAIKVRWHESRFLDGLDNKSTQTKQ